MRRPRPSPFRRRLARPLGAAGAGGPAAPASSKASSFPLPRTGPPATAAALPRWAPLPRICLLRCCRGRTRRAPAARAHNRLRSASSASGRRRRPPATAAAPAGISRQPRERRGQEARASQRRALSSRAVGPRPSSSRAIWHPGSSCAPSSSGLLSRSSRTPSPPRAAHHRRRACHATPAPSAPSADRPTPLASPRRYHGRRPYFSRATTTVRTPPHAHVPAPLLSPSPLTACVTPLLLLSHLSLCSSCAPYQPSPICFDPPSGSSSTSPFESLWPHQPFENHHHCCSPTTC